MLVRETAREREERERERDLGSLYECSISLFRLAIESSVRCGPDRGRDRQKQAETDMPNTRSKNNKKACLIFMLDRFDGVLSS